MDLGMIKAGALRLLTSPGAREPFRRWTRDRIPVLMLHRFTGADSGRGRTTARHLERCARMLAEEDYRTVTLGELCRRASTGRWKERTVCLTVDDGYADFASIAAPILERHGLTCTVFLTTGLIDGDWTWWDRIDYAMARRARAVQEPSVRSWLCKRLGIEPSRRPELLPVLAACKRLEDHDKWRFIGELETRLEVELPARPPAEYGGMSWETARRLAGRGFELGAHTVRHPILSRIPPEQAEAEVLESLDTIERRTGIRPRCFCYPNGRREDYTESIVDLLERSEIDGAVTTVDGILTRDSFEADRRSRFHIPRVGFPDTRAHFALCVSGFEAARQEMRRLTSAVRIGGTP